MSEAPAAAPAAAAPRANKGKNAPRRDPFPDEVKAREESDKKIAAFEADTKKYLARLLEIRNLLEEKNTNRGKLVHEYAETRKEINKIHDEIGALFGQRTKAMNRLFEVKKEQGSSAAAAAKKVSDVEMIVPEPYRTRGREAWERTAKKKPVMFYMLREVSKGIDEMELKFQSSPFRSTAEERKFSGKISALKRVPQLVEAKIAEQKADEAKKAASSVVEEVTTSDPKELAAILITNAEKINALRAKIPPLAAKLRELVPKIDASGKGAVELIKERDSLAEKVYSTHGEMTKEKNALTVKLYELRVARNEKRRKEAEAESARIKADIERRKKEEAERIAAAQNKMAYEKELNTIQMLTSYVKSLAPAGYFKPAEKKVDEAALEAQKKREAEMMKSAPLAEIAEAKTKGKTVQLVRKKGIEEDSAPKKGKGKGKKPQQKKDKEAKPAAPAWTPEDMLNHRMEKYGLFETVSVKPPEQVKDIEAALAELEEKRKHYLELREEERKKAVAEAEGSN